MGRSTKTGPWVEERLMGRISAMNEAGKKQMGKTWSRTSTIIVSGLLLVFFSLMVRAFAQGKEINCGCFGPNELISWKTLARDGSLLAASLFLTVMRFRNRRNAPQATSPRIAPPPGPAPPGCEHRQSRWASRLGSGRGRGPPASQSWTRSHQSDPRPQPQREQEV